VLGKRWYGQCGSAQRADAHAHAGRVVVADRHSDRLADADGDAETEHVTGDPDPDSDRDPNSDAEPDSHSDADRESDGDSDPHADAKSVADLDDGGVQFLDDRAPAAGRQRAGLHHARPRRRTVVRR
jgi:hypothetical protein